LRSRAASCSTPASCAIAAELAHRQAAQLTREAYAGVYRSFCRFLSLDVRPEALTPESVRAYRDQLERDGRSPATIAKHLSALRTLASELGVEGVRAVAHRRRRAPTRERRAAATRDPPFDRVVGDRAIRASGDRAGR
jgi:site-specific recombinase XerD